MFESTWGTITFGRTGYPRGSIIQRISSENLGNSGQNHKKQDNKNVQGSVEQTLYGWGNMGKRGWPKIWLS